MGHERRANAIAVEHGGSEIFPNLVRCHVCSAQHSCRGQAVGFPQRYIYDPIDALSSVIVLLPKEAAEWMGLLLNQRACSGIIL